MVNLRIALLLLNNPETGWQSEAFPDFPVLPCTTGMCRATQKRGSPSYLWGGFAGAHPMDGLQPFLLTEVATSIFATMAMPVSVPVGNDSKARRFGWWMASTDGQFILLYR